MNHPLTIIVDAAIIVLVTILHEFLNVILRDGLSSSLKHYLQLIQVDIAISVSSVWGKGVSEPMVRAGGERNSPTHNPERQGRATGRWGIPLPHCTEWETEACRSQDFLFPQFCWSWGRR